MRKIKFRGQDLATGKWVYGDLLHFYDGTVCIGVHNDTWTDDGFHNNEYAEVVKVKPETIGQFTDLRDKNDNEIYEDDVIAWGARLQFGGIIVWNKNLGCFQIKGSAYLFEKHDYSEVIGNIHDNTELKLKYR